MAKIKLIGGVTMKIKHKISLVAIIMCIVCVGTMWGLNNFISLRYLEDTIQDKVIAEVKLKANDINAWILKEKQNLEIVAERVILAENYENDTLYKVLEKTDEMGFGNLYYLALEDGTFIDASGRVPHDYNPLTRDWYVKAKENSGQIYVCDPYVDTVTKNLVLTLSKEITLNDGRKAVLGVDMQISNIDQYVNSIGKYSVDAETSATLSNASYKSTLDKAKESYYIFLIDRRGNIISHPNPDFSAKPDKITRAAEILEGKLDNLIKLSSVSLYQRIIKDYDGKERAFFFDKVDEAGWAIGIAVDKDAILEAKDKFEKITLFISIIFLCAGIGVSFVIANGIARPIMMTKKMADNISNLKLNIDVDEKYLNRKDEVGEIFKAFKVIIEKLRDFTANLKELSTINNKIYNITLEKITTLLRLSEEVSATTQELSAGMEETSATTESISQSAADLNTAMSMFATKAEEGAKTANEIARKAAELDEQFKESKDNTMNILDVAKNEVASAVESAKNVEQVRMLAEAILSIAAKTNILSLNASIEAARAGEEGRGFGVVAEEIRRLAEDSNRSAGRIKQFAENIDTSVNRLISATNNLLKFLDENVLKDYTLMLNAIENYRNDGAVLSGVLGELSNTVEQLKATVNSVATAINDVSATMQQATAATASIAEQNSEMVSAVRDIDNAMKMNTESSNKLASMIAQVEL